MAHKCAGMVPKMWHVWYPHNESSATGLWWTWNHLLLQSFSETGYL